LACVAWFQAIQRAWDISDGINYEAGASKTQQAKEACKSIKKTKQGLGSLWILNPQTDER